MPAQSEGRTETLSLDDGHRITYTIFGDTGNKPILLFVIGSSGLGSLYRRLAIELSTHFKCVYYDKRGFLPRNTDRETAAQKKNPLVLATQHADDAAALVRYLSPSQLAFVFGTSTGGTAVLDLVVRYSQLIHTAILHEPITFSVMSRELGNEMVALYQKVASFQDPFKGLSTFAQYMFSPVDSSNAQETINPWANPPPSPSATEVYNSRQAQHEALAMVEYVVDQEKARSVADKLLLVRGIDSSNVRVGKPGAALARLLGGQKRTWELAGGHMSFADKNHAPEFCQQLLFVLHQEGRISLRNGDRTARI